MRAGSGLPGELEESSFNVSQNDAISRKANLPEVATGIVGGPAIVGIGIWLLWLTIKVRFELSPFLGSFVVIALGGYLFGFIMRRATKRLDRITVNGEGVEFFSDGSPSKRIIWSQSSLRISISDFRGKSSGGRTWNTVPCMIEARGVSGGISGAAADAIETAARHAGLLVTVHDRRIVREVKIRPS